MGTCCSDASSQTTGETNNQNFPSNGLPGDVGRGGAAALGNEDADLAMALALSLHDQPAGGAHDHSTNFSAQPQQGSAPAELAQQLDQLQSLVPCFRMAAAGPLKNWSCRSDDGGRTLRWSPLTLPSDTSLPSPSFSLEAADARMRRAGLAAPWGWSYGKDGLISLTSADDSAAIEVFRKGAASTLRDDVGQFQRRSFAEKYGWFQTQAERVRQPTTFSEMKFLEVFVERRHLFDASLHALLPMDIVSWQRLPLKVQFVNEPGMDAGGLTREFYSLIASSLCGEKGLFEPIENGSALYKVGTSSSILGLHRYRYAGRIFGKALLDGLCPGVTLSLPLLKVLTARPLFWHDLQHLDESYFNSLLKVFECPQEQVLNLCLDFSAPASGFEYLPRDRAQEGKRKTMDPSYIYEPTMCSLWEVQVRVRDTRFYSTNNSFFQSLIHSFIYFYKIVVQLESGAWAPYSPDEQALLRAVGKRGVVSIHNRFGQYSVDKAKMQQTSKTTGYRRPVRERKAPEPFNVTEADAALVQQENQTVGSGSTASNDFVVLKENKDREPEIVTGRNLEEFVKISAAERLCLGQRQRISALCLGVFEIVPAAWLAVFEPSELALLLGGVPAVNASEWRQHTKIDMSGLSPADRNGADIAVDMFWQVINSFDDQQRARLLRFATGSARVPVGGFSKLAENNQHGVAFELKLVARNEERSGAQAWRRLPRGHTCFNRLDLPLYKSTSEMTTCLEAIISMDMSAIEIGLE